MANVEHVSRSKAESITNFQDMTAIEILQSPVTLPCGLKLPHRFAKCPMQETLAVEENDFEVPIEGFRNLYAKWARAGFGLIITGQVQVDLRFLSIPGDVVVRKESLEPENLARWTEWAQIAQAHGTPCIVQLAHPGRMSPKGAGKRPADMQPLSASDVPVQMSDRWIDKVAAEALLGTPRPCTEADITEVVEQFKVGARVAAQAGFAGIQLHAAHGFLISQFLSPYTNRRNDKWGGSPENRLRFLQRLVREIREEHPPPFCLSVKLNSGDYLREGGLGQAEALEQVRWLATCGLVDLIEISGGIAEQQTSGLHKSMNVRSMDKAPTKKKSTRIREAFFTEFCEKVQQIDTNAAIQLSGGFRSRIGMADAIESGVCQVLGLGRSVVLEPELPREVLLNKEIPDQYAIAMPHIVKGLWVSNWFPVKVVGQGLPIQFFYFNMKRLGKGLRSDPDASIPYILFASIVDALFTSVSTVFSRFFSGVNWQRYPIADIDELTN